MGGFMTASTISTRNSMQQLPDLTNPVVLEQAREEARKLIREESKRRSMRRLRALRNR
jgi:hypothetical protein